jgi:hypothetical protein
MLTLPCCSQINYGNITLRNLGLPLVFCKETPLDLNLEALPHYKFNLMTNVSIENRLNLYSNYLDNPENVDIDYQMNVAMRINKYLTAMWHYKLFTMIIQ